jgi:hypothetical protein
MPKPAGVLSPQRTGCQLFSPRLISAHRSWKWLSDSRFSCPSRRGPGSSPPVQVSPGAPPSASRSAIRPRLLRKRTWPTWPSYRRRCGRVPGLRGLRQRTHEKSPTDKGVDRSGLRGEPSGGRLIKIRRSSVGRLWDISHPGWRRARTVWPSTGHGNGRRRQGGSVSFREPQRPHHRAVLPLR